MDINKRSIVGFSILLILMFFTGYFIVKSNDMVDVISSIFLVDYKFLLIGILLTTIGYFSLEAFKFYRLLKPLEKKVTFRKCIKYSTIGYFFSGITPFATGGQPMQLYYMSKDDLDLSNTSLVMLISTLAYKIVLVIVTIIILIFANDILTGCLGRYLWMYYLCFGLNLIMITCWALLIISPGFFKKIVLKLEKFFVKIHILKYNNKRIENIDNFTINFIAATKYFKKNKLKLLEVMLFSFLNRLLIVSITYVVYRGFGLDAEGFWKIVTLQMIIMLTIDMLPLPGGQGASELLYFRIFSPIFTGALLPATMLITRAVGFYIPLIISLLMSGGFALFRAKTKLKANN